MKAKFTILIAAALFFTIGTQAETNNVTNYGGNIRHERVAMVHARNDIRADRADMRYDRMAGDRRDYFHDRYDLRVDHRDFFHDRYALHRDIRDRRCW